jgi:hypothetical protein
MNSLNFSHVDSLDKAFRLASEGILEPSFLLPVEFGGASDPRNTLYVPTGIAAVKYGHDMNVILPLIQAGKVQEYYAAPEYEGGSIVPAAINIRAWGNTDVEVNLRIDIWSKEVSDLAG